MSAQGTPSPRTVAAVDLGSNSFHLVIARATHQDLHLLDRLREPVQLAAGLDDEKRLTEEVEERALACLARFGQRLRDIPHDQIRAVGTDALRRAKNARAFLRKAQLALGDVPIEIVPGREEARLIYLGVAHSLPEANTRRLVIDIGGGSTELILGEGFEVLEAESLRMGCVTWTRRFFPGGTVDRERFRAAEVTVQRELQPIERRLKTLGWESCIGSSGTVQSVEECLRVAGWGDAVTLDGLKRLRKAVIAAGTTQRLDLPGIREERAQVLPGGLAILLGGFEALGIERLTAASGAMREGLLYDLLGRIRHEDVRDRTIRRLSERYHIDVEHAARVERTLLALWKQSALGWALESGAARQSLIWAARLHEAGLMITFSGYHKHGAYLVTHSDMPGFSSDDQLLLAALIQHHRRRLVRATFEALPGIDTEQALRLALLLRLAVLLNRARTPRPLPIVSLTVGSRSLALGFPAGWLGEHPLTRADLEDERSVLDGAGYELRFG